METTTNKLHAHAKQLNIEIPIFNIYTVNVHIILLNF